MSSMFDEETETATNEGQEHQAQSGGPGVVIDLDSINVPYDTAAIKRVRRSSASRPLDCWWNPVEN